MFEDNTVAITFQDKYQNIRKVKHYVSRAAFLQIQKEEGTFHFTHVNTKDQLADALTKPLPREQFNKFKQEIGIVDLENTWKRDGNGNQLVNLK